MDLWIDDDEASFDVPCPSCATVAEIGPDDTFAGDEPFWCPECGHVFGAWADVLAAAMRPVDLLSDLLARRRG